MKIFYWSRKPGKFLDKLTGNEAVGARFQGNVREWYETLIETIIDASSSPHEDMSEEAHEMRLNILMNENRPENWYEMDIFRHCQQGELTLKVGPSAGVIIECSVLYKPNLKNTSVGSLNNRFRVVFLEKDIIDDDKNHEIKIFEDDELIGVVKVTDMNVI